ncbi:P-loop containing nucleoside triphosphate hydrolase protein [Xylariaceae sp. FL0594]|nr:P-loop containing nucleoside triphosphate hydrolase protein [Xylariaceae sp. FL0594]
MADKRIIGLYCVPSIALPFGFDLYNSFGDTELPVRGVISRIQNGAPADAVKTLLAYYHSVDPAKLRQSTNVEVDGIPAIFYVVATDDPRLIRYWVKYGGNPNATYGPRAFPLLAFCVMHDRKSRTMQQATKTLETLLALGASADAIPEIFYSPFNIKLDTNLLDTENAWHRNWRYRWCATEERKAIASDLASALNLTQRYRLFQASQTKPPSCRIATLAARTGSERVLGLQYTVIGQQAAVAALKSRLMVKLALETDKPLVFLFAGPSGHGKSEIARSLGELTSTEMISIDCTVVTDEKELFGPRMHYKGSAKGSPLNNYLVRMSGSRGIVFLDEFEKTTTEIHNALLIPFDQGEYYDRRTSNKVSCSKTIWILATNIFDDYILDFCAQHRAGLFQPGQEKTTAQLLDDLKACLRKNCMFHFGHALTGRISEIVPFLTFPSDEQAVVSHKGIMDFEARVRRPVVLSPNANTSSYGQGDHLVGNVRLDIEDEHEICSAIATKGYLPQLGARGILNAAAESVYTPLVSQYLDIDEDLKEDQPETTFRVHVDADQEIKVWQALARRD